LNDDKEPARSCPKCVRTSAPSILPKSLQRRVSRAISIQQPPPSTSARKVVFESSQLNSSQEEALSAIKSVYKTSPSVQILRQLASKSLLTLSKEKSSHLITDNELKLSPALRFNSEGIKK
jgi:hypothetical protein